MTIEMSAADRILIERAGCHAVRPELLTPDARFQDGVTDLHVARVMLELDRGHEVLHDLLSGRWSAPERSGLGRYLLGATAREMVRTGLAAEVRRTGHAGCCRTLVPASVHLLTEFAGRKLSRCSVPGEGKGPKRVRLLADPIMVDCLACLDRL